MPSAAAASTVQGDTTDVIMTTPNEDAGHAMEVDRQEWSAILAPDQQQTIENDRVRQAVAEQTGQTQRQGGDIIQTGQLLTLVQAMDFEDDYSDMPGHSASGSTTERRLWQALKDVSDLSTVQLEEGLTEDAAEWKDVTREWMRRCRCKNPRQAYSYLTRENIEQLRDGSTTKVFLAAPTDDKDSVASKSKDQRSVQDALRRTKGNADTLCKLHSTPQKVQHAMGSE